MNGLDPVVSSLFYGSSDHAKGKLKCIQWLLKEGILKLADLYPQNLDLLTNTYPEMLDFLIKNNLFKVNQKLNGGWGNSLLHHCHKPEMVQFLIQKGANVNAKNEAGEAPLHILATVRGHNVKPFLESIQLLLENGADVNSKDSKGRTPLSRASEPKVKKLLISYGAI